MKYAFLIAWREFAESAKAKGFWIGLFIMPAILFFSIQAPIWLEQKATPVRYFVVVDQSHDLAPVIESRMEKVYQERVLEVLKDYARKHASNSASILTLSSEDFQAKGGKEKLLQTLELKAGAPIFESPRRQFKFVKLAADIDLEADIRTLAEELKPYLRGARKLNIDGQTMELTAAVLIPKDISGLIVRPGDGANRQSKINDNQIQFWSANASDPRLREEIERAVNSEIRRREYLAQGMDEAAIRQVEQTYIPVASLNPKKEKGKEAISTADIVKQWAPSGFVYLLWLAIFVIIQMLLNNTIEEKSNRIIEVLLSSVTPGELMMGKLFGIAAIGLTMIGAWMFALFGILSWKAGGASEIAGHILTALRSSNLVPLFSVYFLLGYLMYAGLILSIGSVCNTIKEAQSYMGVLTMVMMVPLLTMTFIPRDPNGPIARLLSWIPPYTPFTMMNRAAADPPLFDLIGTLVLLLVSTGGVLWMSGKVFRIGILRTGQPPKVVEMLRWALSKSRG